MVLKLVTISQNPSRNETFKQVNWREFNKLNMQVGACFGETYMGWCSTEGLAIMENCYHPVPACPRRQRGYQREFLYGGLTEAEPLLKKRSQIIATWQRWLLQLQKGLFTLHLWISLGVSYWPNHPQVRGQGACPCGSVSRAPSKAMVWTFVWTNAHGKY